MVQKPQAKPRQIDEFRKAARELGCDESEERFQEGIADDWETENRSARLPNSGPPRSSISC
jgi:hypothetical protein